MKTDTIFYQLFQTFPSLLFELIGLAPDLAQGYEFSSQEIKELARRLDGIFLPPKDNPDKAIYFVEVQFQTNPDFYWRFFSEIFIYIGQYKPSQNWQAVAIFASKSIAAEIPLAYRGLNLEEKLKIVYLDEINKSSPSLAVGIVQLVVENTPTVEQTNKLLQQTKEKVIDAAFQQKVIELIETILVYKFTKLSREEIEAMFGLSDLKQTRVYQQAKEEGKIESVTRLLAIGLTIEQIATALDLDIKIVQQVAGKAAENNS